MESNMPLIADTYKLIGQIGSGGGSVIYLAEHLRLHKLLVLKADKRMLSKKPNVLRREVDALKNLNHSAIPQVYDFIEEDGTVYTVMDYIDGESFDKPLRRGERFSQDQVISWACQLLEALVYLHNRPPHGILHADIKPSNVMLTPQGDVRLIDFNIALALGEEGAIAVGRSFGYASPEHYGLDYSSADRTQDTASHAKTILESVPEASSSWRTSGRKAVMLDLRSDIYSMGATLYHILTGLRPSQNADEVTPISERTYSSAVAGIIMKAMNPSPDLRWQSAKEMLYAFEHLRENDPRVKRHKRTIVVTTILLSLLCIAGIFASFVGLKQMEQLQNMYVLAEYSGNALRAGDVASAIDYALQALTEKRVIFMPPNTAEAQKALTDALHVYDLSDGFKTHKTVELPSAPLYMKISPNGKTGACVYAYAVAIFDTATAQIITTLPVEHSALSEVKFLNDDTIIYARDGGVRAYDIVKGIDMWVGRPATSIAISADGKNVAAIYKDDSFAIVYDAVSGRTLHHIDFGGKHQRIIVNDSFANPNDNLFSLNRDGSLLALSLYDGSMRVYNLRMGNGYWEFFDKTEAYTRFEGGFHKEFFVFSVTDPEESHFAVIDTVELEQAGEFASKNPFGVQADESGVYLQTENILVHINPITGEQTALVSTFENIVRFVHDGNHTLMTTKDEILFFDKNAKLISRHEKEYGSDFVQIAEGTAIIGSLDSHIIRIMKLERNQDTEFFSYDPAYRHDEARFCVDNNTVMLYSYDQFRLYDLNGHIIEEMCIPDAEQVYEPQYRRDEHGSRLEVTYNNGIIREYSAKDGSLICETVGERPDLTFMRNFFTDKLRIEAPLHGTPVAYDRRTDKRIRELDKDAYLTYVTQVGEYIITEYITADGYRYGLLLNDRCQTLAKLPYLSDIVGEELIFNYPTGVLRKSPIYHVNELIEFASTY